MTMIRQDAIHVLSKLRRNENVGGKFRLKRLLSDPEGEAIDLAIEALREPPRRSGWWQDDAMSEFVTCSVCHVPVRKGELVGIYCPGCGAKMSGFDVKEYYKRRKKG